MRQVSVFLLAIACAVVTAAGQIALKVGVMSPALQGVLSAGAISSFFSKAVMSPLVLLGLALYGLSAVLWLLVLARAELSYAFPLVSLGFVFSTIYAYLGMHEQVGPLRLAGIAFIIVGVAFVSRS